VNTHIVATTKDWNIKNFNTVSHKIQAHWHLITNKEDLTYEKIEPLNPRYIFFPHRSWIIPKEVHSNFKRVAFHMTTLPFGRGESIAEFDRQRNIRDKN